jgi:hypothetical protein
MTHPRCMNPHTSPAQRRQGLERSTPTKLHRVMATQCDDGHVKVASGSHHTIRVLICPIAASWIHVRASVHAITLVIAHHRSGEMVHDFARVRASLPIMTRHTHTEVQTEICMTVNSKHAHCKALYSKSLLEQYRKSGHRVL